MKEIAPTMGTKNTNWVPRAWSIKNSKINLYVNKYIPFNYTDKTSEKYGKWFKQADYTPAYKKNHILVLKLTNNKPYEG